jgi:hypothetical protein
MLTSHWHHEFAVNRGRHLLIAGYGNKIDINSSPPERRRSISPMLECAWSYGHSKLGSGCQQYSNNSSSMMYRSDLGFICYVPKNDDFDCLNPLWSPHIYFSVFIASSCTKVVILRPAYYNLLGRPRYMVNEARSTRACS